MAGDRLSLRVQCPSEPLLSIHVSTCSSAERGLGFFVPVSEIPGTPSLSVQWGWQGGRAEDGCCRAAWPGLGLRGTCGAVRGHCLSLAMLGSKPLSVPWCSRKAAVALPSQPLMVPLGRTCGPSCHQGLVPSTLEGVDRRTQ